MVARGYKETEIGVIPDEWKTIKLGSICHTTTGKLNANAMVDNGQYKFFTCAKEPYLIDEYKFDTEALLISGNGANVGYIHYYNGKFNAYQRTYVLDKFTNNIQYIKYILQRLLKDRIDKEKNAGNTPYITLDTITEMNIPLPSLKEQEKIADILSTADEKIDAIASQIQKAQTLKKGLLQKLLSEGIGHSEFKDSELGKIPKSWEVVKLNKLIENKSIISHLDGNHGGLYPKQSEFVENGIPYLSANMIKDNHIDFSLAKFLTKERASKFRKGVAKNKDVLFAHNATVGPVTILRTDLEYVILSTTLTYYRCDLEKLDNYYLMNYMKSIYFINQYEKFMKQSTRNQIPITQQRQLFFIIPLLKEQKQIAEILSTADEKLEVLVRKKEKYETLKKGLLQKLLSGEVRTV